MAGNPVSALAEEQHYFESHRQELLSKYEGRYVLIHGNELLGSFETDQGAYEHGLKKLGNVPMLIVQMLRNPPEEETPHALRLGLLDARPYH